MNIEKMKEQIKKNKNEGNEKGTVIEVDYKEDDIIDISYDVYNLTIAANITKPCSPYEMNYCIRLCV